MLFYETFGNASNPITLIFLHGFLGSRLDWAPIIELLKKDYFCIAIDLPAHGKSPYSANINLALEKTLFFLSPTPPLLIGYSLGGRLALSYGNKHPHKIRGVLAISSHTGLQNDLAKEQRNLEDLAWEERLKTLPCEDFLLCWYNQSVFSSLQKRPLLLKKILLKRKYNNPEELSQILLQASLSKQPLYGDFEHPARFLFGEEDLKYQKLFSSFPPDLIEEIKNAGHTVHLENPQACAEAISRFPL